jgi:hypothetical protein
MHAFTYAQVGLTDRIFSRIQSRESCSVSHSSFGLDLNQVVDAICVYAHFAAEALSIAQLPKSCLLTFSVSLQGGSELYVFVRECTCVYVRMCLCGRVCIYVYFIMYIYAYVYT